MVMQPNIVAGFPVILRSNKNLAAETVKKKVAYWNSCRVYEYVKYNFTLSQGASKAVDGAEGLAPELI